MLLFAPFLNFKPVHSHEPSCHARSAGDGRIPANEALIFCPWKHIESTHIFEEFVYNWYYDHSTSYIQTLQRCVCFQYAFTDKKSMLHLLEFFHRLQNERDSLAHGCEPAWSWEKARRAASKKQADRIKFTHDRIKRGGADVNPSFYMSLESAWP